MSWADGIAVGDRIESLDPEDQGERGTVVELVGAWIVVEWDSGLRASMRADHPHRVRVVK